MYPIDVSETTTCIKEFPPERPRDQQSRSFDDLFYIVREISMAKPHPSYDVPNTTLSYQMVTRRSRHCWKETPAHAYNIWNMTLNVCLPCCLLLFSFFCVRPKLVERGYVLEVFPIMYRQQNAAVAAAARWCWMIRGPPTRITSVPFG